MNRTKCCRSKEQWIREWGLGESIVGTLESFADNWANLRVLQKKAPIRTKYPVAPIYRGSESVCAAGIVNSLRRTERGKDRAIPIQPMPAAPRTPPELPTYVYLGQPQTPIVQRASFEPRKATSSQRFRPAWVNGQRHGWHEQSNNSSLNAPPGRITTPKERRPLRSSHGALEPKVLESSRTKLDTTGQNHKNPGKKGAQIM